MYCTVVSAPRWPKAVSLLPRSFTAPPRASIEMPASCSPLPWAACTWASSALESTSGAVTMWEVAANACRCSEPPGPVWHWPTGIDEQPA